MKHLFIVIKALEMLLLPTTAAAREPTPYMIHIIYSVAHKHHVDPEQMLAIAAIESRFVPNALRRNNNLTLDYGLFQINSVHFNTTCKKYDVFGLRGNAECAAVLLAKLKKKHGASDPMWVGRYHSNTFRKKVFYVKMLMMEMDK